MKTTPVLALVLILVLAPHSLQFVYAQAPLADSEQVPESQLKAVQKSQEKIQNLLDETTALKTQLDSLKLDIVKLGSDLEKAKNEDWNVLHDQRHRKYAELQNELTSLVKNIKELESAGMETVPAREVAASYAQLVSTWLKADINSSLNLLAGLDEKTKTATESELPELRQQIAYERQSVDDQLIALLDNSDLMELLGLDRLSDLKFLDKTLVQRAEGLTARLQYLIDQRSGIHKQATGASEDEKNLLKEKVAALDERISSTADNLKLTIKLMDERKLDAVEYKQVVISSTGEITKDIFKSEVALGLLQQSLDSGKNWIVDNGPQWTFKIFVFVLILLVFALLANIVKRVFRRTLGSSRVHASKLLQNLLVSFVGKAVFLVGLLIALSQLGIKIAPLLAGLGIIGFIIGFALQETLSNFAAGMMILIYRPFDVGDAVDTGGVSGRVRQMNLVSTTITTYDNQRVIVPNRKIWGDVIRNIEAEKIRRVDMVFSIGYDDDSDLADQILHEIVDHHELALDDPPPIIRLHTLGESSVDFIVRPWVKTEDYWNAYWHITKAVKKRFDQEGISIPFPQQDLHVYQKGSGTPETGSNGLL